MNMKSGDLFKEAFSKSSEDERHRKSAIDARSRRQLEQVETIKEEVEDIISQIPSVFAVENLSFGRSILFDVVMPRKKSDPDFEEKPHWSVGLFPSGHEKFNSFSVSITEYSGEYRQGRI